MTWPVTATRMGVRLTPSFLMGAGLLAAVTAGFEILTETRFVGGSIVELLMLVVPAVGLLYAGYWLQTGDYDPDDVWRIGAFAVGGAVLAAAATAGLLLATSAPTMAPASTFVLFVSTSTEGSLLGVLAGTFVTTDGLFRRERAVAGEFETLHALLRHDLRNRITLMGGNLTLLADDVGVDDDRVRTIRTQLDAVEALLSDTQLATEALRGKRDLGPVDLVAVVRQQCSLLEASYRGVEVSTALPDTADVMADDLLGSVLGNVLTNAVVHHDGPAPDIDVSVEVSDDVVRVAVADDGPGIPPGRRDAVLEPGVGDGTGMGLYLVTTVVEGYSGDVELADNEPRGTVVRLTFTRADR